MRNRLLSVALLSLLLTFLIGARGAQADTLFSQPLAGAAPGWVSDQIQFVADDFTLLSDSILTDFHWWGGYTNTPPGVAPPTEDWDLYIFPDLPSLMNLSDFQATNLFNLARVPTGLVTPSLGNEIFAYTADLVDPVTVTAGTHYAMLLGTGGAGALQRAGWQTVLGASPVSGSWINTGSWHQQVTDQAFEITGTAVPEPASLLLLGTGLVGLRAWRKRRG